MYSLSQVKTALREPRRAVWELNRLYYRRLGLRPHNTRGLDLFDADWDNLLVLDACRYDMFEELVELPGTLEARTSRASATKEWVEANFDGRTLHDTVYVTASPILYRNRESVSVSFHDVFNVWKDEGWSDEYRTVLPETVNAVAERAAEQYPNKRLLVHYLQPHYPFLGPTGREHFDLDKLNFQWADVASGRLDIDPSVVRRAFRENLEQAVPYVRGLLRDLDGKTVVTADHGQLLGERGFPIPVKGYGHPPGIYLDPLVRVPWLEYVNGPRKDIVAEQPVTGHEDVDDTIVTDRLEQLGYVR